MKTLLRVLNDHCSFKNVYLHDSIIHLLSIEVGVPLKGASGSREGEHRKRDRDGNVDAHLTYINLGLKLPSHCPRCGENSRAIPIRVGIDHINSLQDVHPFRIRVLLAAYLIQ